MPLEPGTQLGPYTVTEQIGQGGMGEVYRARDANLDRDVALKVLPDAFTADPDRLARFEREAKVLASLNHPNIGAIYGLEKSGDTRALVLELIEGPTLADRIAQGPIPLDEALPIAKQIAEALEAAHEAGVIHRDLKPANVKVKADGTVKVLDFGLAKAFAGGAGSDPSESPTVTAAAVTGAGVIMGTVAYMAPEQAKGQPVDTRADIWAFGAVLYEMLTGARAFVGDDVSDTLAAVLRAEVNMDGLPEDTPARLRQVVRACLQRDPRQRVHAIGDVRLAMEGVFETISQESDATRQVGWRVVLPLSLTMLLLGSLVTSLVIGNLSGPDASPPSRFTVLAPVGLNKVIGPSLVTVSPDGRSLVFAGEDRLYTRDLSQLEW